MKQQGTAWSLDRDWGQGPCWPSHGTEPAFYSEPDTKKGVKSTLEESSALAEGLGWPGVAAGGRQPAPLSLLLPWAPVILMVTRDQTERG